MFGGRKSISTVAEKWRRKRNPTPQLSSKVYGALILSLALLFLLILYCLAKPAYTEAMSARLSVTNNPKSHPFYPPQCYYGNIHSGSSEAVSSLKWLPEGEKYMWYAPHSGFSNQIGELKNALVMAGILNRTLIVPPVLDHHAVALGSCPKFRVKSGLELRSSVWDHIMQLMRESRYASITDFVDLSELVTSSLVKTIDFRVFVSLWCGLDIQSSCSGKQCHSLASKVGKWGSVESCKDLLTGRVGNQSQCVYPVDQDCRTTIWTYKQEHDNVLDRFQPDDRLKKKKKIDYVRRRQNVEKKLGIGSPADSASLLLFGSLFSTEYKGSQSLIDIQHSPNDVRIQKLLHKLDFLPFTSEILNAGKEYVKDRFKNPFLCAQLRLLDGQFKSHWNATFSALKEKLTEARKQIQGTIDIFIMTDLPPSNWTGTYLGGLAADVVHYKLHVLKENDKFLTSTAKKVMQQEFGLKTGILPSFLNVMDKKEDYSSSFLPDVQLYVEETICSCASIGFVGTTGSTIADNIEKMRKNNICSLR